MCNLIKIHLWAKASFLSMVPQISSHDTRDFNHKIIREYLGDVSFVLGIPIYWDQSKVFYDIWAISKKSLKDVEYIECTEMAWHTKL